jgi:hypothetical protein
LNDIALDEVVSIPARRIAERSSCVGFSLLKVLIRLPSELSAKTKQTVNNKSYLQETTVTHSVTDKTSPRGSNSLGRWSALCELGLLVRTIPTAPESYMRLLWNSVTGLPVMNGVEEARIPS